MTLELHLHDVGLSYQHKDVFAHINLSVPAGKWVAILGTSGVGKSSLLRLLAGLLNKDEQVTGKVSLSNQQPITKHIAYMAQQDLLLPWLNAYDNAQLACTLSSTPSATKMRLANKLFQQTGLKNDKHLFPHALSGGMRQRVALIRTLLQEKPIVLMDEPFSALDTLTRFHLQNLARELLHDKTVIFVTHDPAEALRLADSIYLMHGTPARLTSLAQLSTSAPRDIHNKDNQMTHAQLFQALTKHGEQHNAI